MVIAPLAVLPKERLDALEVLTMSMNVIPWNFFCPSLFPIQPNKSFPQNDPHKATLFIATKTFGGRKPGLILFESK